MLMKLCEHNADRQDMSRGRQIAKYQEVIPVSYFLKRFYIVTLDINN